MRWPTGVRALRNLSPARLRHSDRQWIGLRSIQTDPEYCQFTSMAHGVRALAVTLAIYRDNHHRLTVRDIVHEWRAQKPDDETLFEAHDVAYDMGVWMYDCIDTTDNEVMFGLVRAIIRLEIGLWAWFVSDSTVRDGIAMAKKS
jgi:hypothetical protein